jgi:hypothetical protein
VLQFFPSTHSHLRIAFDVGRCNSRSILPAMSPHFKRPNQANVVEAQEAAPELPPVSWTKSPNMRKLYFYCIILCVCSATTGYDG